MFNVNGTAMIQTIQRLLVILFFITACTSGENNSPRIGHTHDTLKIATWNIYWLADSSYNVRSSGDYTLLKNYAKEMNADVVALQETENAIFAGKVFGSDYDYYFSSRPGGSGTQRVGFAIKRAAGVKIENVEDYTRLDVGGVRYGMDLTLSRNNKTIRLLAVHLKSGCFESPLDANSIAGMPVNTTYEQDLKNACSKLASQKAPLEYWVDTRAGESLPFILLGDFNRRLEVEDNNGYDEEQGLWATIDDPGAVNPYEDLTRINDNLTPKCWNAHFDHYIDHIIVDPRAKNLVVDNSFSELLYVQSSYTDYHQRLSDHCAISVLVNM